MRIDEFTLRAKDETRAVLSWTSVSENMLSWIFVNGRFVLGPFVPQTLERSITIPLSAKQCASVEIHEFDDWEQLPNATEEMPQIKPLLSWNPVAEAVRYRIYHGDFSNGEESMVSEVNARQGVERMEINSPVELDGKNGHWYWFRVESLDKYNHESQNGGEFVKFFATDLPPVPELILTKQSNGKYIFSF